MPGSPPASKVGGSGFLGPSVWPGWAPAVPMETVSRAVMLRVSPEGGKRGVFCWPRSRDDVGGAGSVKRGAAVLSMFVFCFSLHLRVIL